MSRELRKPKKPKSKRNRGACKGHRGSHLQALEYAHKQAHQHVPSAIVKPADATTWLKAGLTMSLWTLSSNRTTVFQGFKDGARATIESIFPENDGQQTDLLVSDRASVFGFWPMTRRTGALGKLDDAALVFHDGHGSTSGTLLREEMRHWIAPVQRRFAALLARISSASLRGLSGACDNIILHDQALTPAPAFPGV